MSQDINQLLFTHGSLQVSPAQAIKLNQTPHIAFFDETIASSPSQSGYAVLLTGYSQFVLDNENKTKDSFSLRSALNGLKSVPRPISGQKLKGSVSTFSVSNYDYRIDYRILSGQIEVYNIQLTDKLQLARDKLEKIAVYKVKKTNSGTWVVSQKMDNEQVDTLHAAVNGQSNNLAKATWLMGSHLEYEYGKQLTEYTLFHNPSVGGAGDTWESMRDKCGVTTGVTKRFASVLEKAQKKDGDTKWVAHSQGGCYFFRGCTLSSKRKKQLAPE